MCFQRRKAKITVLVHGIHCMLVLLVLVLLMLVFGPLALVQTGC